MTKKNVQSLEMSLSEIVASYREAKDKKSQIKILAELNVCSQEIIIEALKLGGVRAAEMPRNRISAQEPKQEQRTKRNSKKEVNKTMNDNKLDKCSENAENETANDNKFGKYPPLTGIAEKKDTGESGGVTLENGVPSSGNTASVATFPRGGRLEDTVGGMLSADYKERFRAEYMQTKIRYERLKSFCNRIEVAELWGRGDIPKHDCLYEMLRQQQRYMGEYLHILELRAIIENVDL